MSFRLSLWIATLLCAAAGAWAHDSESSEAPRLEIRQEMARQREIYLSRGDSVPSGYTIDRSLLTYTQGLASGFRRSLAELGSRDRWLDIGAGEGRAVVDYCTSRYEAYFDGFEPRPRADERARAVAMSIEDRRTQRWYEALKRLPPGQIEYLHGKSMSEYPAEELGEFQLVTDMMGGFSYTPRLSVFLEKVLGILAVDGSFYGVLADVRADRADNPPHYAGSPHLTRIVTADGREITVCDWLKRIGCVEVSCEFKGDWTPPIETYRVRKLCTNVRIPALVLDHFESGTPPERRFRLVEDAPVVPTAASR
jgi:SAM-dependent methyltransferase